ncbi:MAG TPA: hypothetical protein VGV41_22575 [Pseudolabrys sp.]|uniref:hypothetical protein n=1 Tax=Pseudolabrys sp. TaxID=1960880 RepID=UPI002DDD979D|nr:hypothetical protein [Pseudolabrys sp.]HEV2631419.1 hypothetical protein [Pseudolabrys sp.]
MAIANDAELIRAVSTAGRLVQEIQDYCGRSARDNSRINFPRGLIGTAEQYRNLCPSYLSQRQKSSCAYGFMYIDVVWWLLARTDLSGIAKEMTIKSAIITLGTVLEAVLHIPGQGIFASMAGVKKRLDRATIRGWLSEQERDSLKQLWDHRNNVHIRLLDTHEFDKYRSEHFNEPRQALKALMANLKSWDEAGRR